MPRLSDLLDPSIDAAAVDGRQAITIRLVLAALTAGVLAANLGLAIATPWFTAATGCEFLDRRMTRTLAAGLAGTPGQRLQYLVVTCAGTMTWTAIPVLFWFSQRPALQLAAIVVLAGQLIHAQAFAFRSKAVLLLTGGVPALALCILPTVYGRFAGMEVVTIGLCLLGTSP